jgi:GT2 family glycosyltransferase
VPELSVVIPVYGNWWLTQRCLRELDRLRGGGSTSFETIVVDNASPDETPREIRAFPWVRYVRHETNRNFAGACNAGARLAQAPLTLFLNNDAYPLGDALTPLVRAFDRDEVAIAGGALFFEDGVTQAAGLVLLSNAHWHYYCRNLPALGEVNRSRDALAVSGAAMAVRTRWFVEAGGLDESFVNGFEDVDLCMRTRERGYAIAYVAEARFAHYEAASAGRFDREAENERRFYRRWSAKLAALPRTARGDVGAIVVRSAESNPLLRAALKDLTGALRSFGHPVAYGGVAPWRRFDRRFRRAATLAWFSDDVPVRGVSIVACDGSSAGVRTHGAATLEVSWLPCASLERAERLKLRRSEDRSCNLVGIAGGDVGDGAASFDSPTLRITPQMLLGETGAELACVVHLGRTDEAAFGNVLLAHAGLPAIVLARDELKSVFAPDVALTCEPQTIAQAVSRVVADPALRAHYGSLVAADAQRRFTPRRSAIRIVDLLCAARFGLERPGVARADAPF